VILRFMSKSSKIGIQQRCFNLTPKFYEGKHSKYNNFEKAMN